MRSIISLGIWAYVASSNNKYILGYVAIATALQLEAARATPVLSCFNYDAIPSLKTHLTYPLPYYSVLLLKHYFTL